MTGWMIAIGYLAGYMWTVRKVAVSVLESNAQRVKDYSTYEGKPLNNTEDRILALVMGALVGIVWPVALVFLAISKTLKAPTEIAVEKERELEALRKLAREHNLPMPEQKANR